AGSLLDDSAQLAGLDRNGCGGQLRSLATGARKARCETRVTQGRRYASERSRSAMIGTGARDERLVSLPTRESRVTNPCLSTAPPIMRILSMFQLPVARSRS